jgi:hypothetical protein
VKKQMKNSNANVLKSIGIVTVLLMSAFIMTISDSVEAQDEIVGGVTAHGGQPVAGYEGPTTIPAGETPDYTIYPLAFLSVSPNPIGLGQELLVNMWITFPSGEGKYMTGYTVNITKPDGTTELVKLKSYVADGTSWFSYIVDQTGEWHFQFSFAGEWFPAGYWRDGEYSSTRTGNFSNAIFNPSVFVAPAESPVTILTVQQDLVASWQSSLPNDYWTRPILPNNREWYTIAGNYPWAEFEGQPTQASDRENYYGPYVTAPNTPHIVWKELGGVAGIIGGEAGQYSSLSAPGTPSVIFMGRCYQTKTVPINGVPTNCAVCYDLQTGEQYYAIPIVDGGVTPTHIAYWRGVDTAVPGAGEAAGIGAELITVSGNRLYKINPLTGAVAANISLPSMGASPGNLELYYRNGYFLAFQNTGSINVTRANITVTTTYTGNWINWTSQGASTNFTSRIISNVSGILPTSLRTLYQVGAYGNLGAYDPESGITVIQSRFIHGGYYGSTYQAVDVTTGQLIWNVTTPVDLMESAYRPTNAWARHGRYIAEMERGYVQARDIQNGDILWETEIGDYPWGEFWLYDVAAYSDMVLGVGYTGVWAINETNGDIVWHYADPAVPFETPYNSNFTEEVYAVQTIRVADGKVYVQNNEHTPTQPATRGWGLICLNVTNGDFMWKISGANLGPGGASQGYLTASSSYSGYFYVLGKGKTALTLNAPQTALTPGQGVVVAGTILDMSPAQPGTACVSSDSMSTWMDYLHHQMPMDGYYHNVTITGVPISIDAVDPNGNFVHVADVTSDSSGAFGYTWIVPSMAGDYKIIATFMGDDSYGSSYSTVFVNVAEGGKPTPTPTPTGGGTVATTADLMTYFIIGIVVILIAIGIIGALVLRRH